MLTNYRKHFQRENSLVALGVWEREQGRAFKEAFGCEMPIGLHDVTEGLDTVYYREDALPYFAKAMTEKMASDPAFFSTAMAEFEDEFGQLEAVWKRGVLKNQQELKAFCQLIGRVWAIGIDVVSLLPENQTITQEERQRAFRLREKTADFLDASDRVIVATLKQLYPTVADSVRYLTLDEAVEGRLPSMDESQRRQKQFVCYGDRVFVGKTVGEIAQAHGLQILREPLPQATDTLRGQTAMGGKVTGLVRVLLHKSEIPSLEDGEILVTYMTTPDFVSAMKKAAAFVTDEGGITCHAAIVAREFGKPCVVGTKFATQILKTGMQVEVDASQGIVQILPL